MFKKFYLSDIIKNDEEIKEGLRELLINIDKEHNQFCVDVYLYIDSNGIGSLDTFTNVGGNSWRNDEHYVLTSVNYEYNKKIDAFEFDNMLEIIGKTYDEIKFEAANYYGYDVNESEMLNYIEKIEEYTKKLVEAYDEFCDDAEYDVNGIIDRFCDEYLEQMMYIYENDENRNIFDDIIEIAYSLNEIKIDQICSIACFLNKYDRFTYDSERYDNETCVQKIKFFKDDKIVKSLKVGVCDERKKNVV